MLESGSGSDVANLTSPGSGIFTSTPTYSSLVVGGVTVLTVNTYTGSLTAPIPAQVNITGNSNGTDVADLYDGTGSNAAVATGNQATLVRTLTLDSFRIVVQAFAVLAGDLTELLDVAPSTN